MMYYEQQIGMQIFGIAKFLNDGSNNHHSLQQYTETMSDTGKGKGVRIN